MRLSCVSLFALSVTMQLVASLCPELQEALSRLPEEYMFDTEYARNVTDTLKNLNASHVWPEEHFSDSLLYKDDADRPVEHDVVVMDERMYWNTFFGENPTEVPWILFSCMANQDVKG